LTFSRVKSSERRIAFTLLTVDSAMFSLSKSIIFYMNCPGLFRRFDLARSK
jgi:hypothetical protein